LSQNKSVPFVVHFYFQRLNNTPKHAQLHLRGPWNEGGSFFSFSAPGVSG
jgi:hypothetical protein